MSDLGEMKNHTHQAQKNLISSLVINLIVPWVVFMLLRRVFTNDTTPLAITAAIPAVKTMVLWVCHRKIDYIGIVGIICFAIALAVTAFSGGNPLPLKLVHPMVFGIIGLVCIISVVIGKPLLMVIFKIITHGKGERFNSPEGRKKSTIMTALLGGISLVSSIVHIIMALILPTGTFVAMSNIVSWVTILALVGSAKLIVPKVK